MSSGATQLMVTEQRVEEVTVRLIGRDGGSICDFIDSLHDLCSH